MREKEHFCSGGEKILPNKSKEILDALNEAFSEAEEPEETNLREKSKTYYLKKVLKKESTSSDRHIKK